MAIAMGYAVYDIKLLQASVDPLVDGKFVKYLTIDAGCSIMPMVCASRHP
jgi:hypothetical protein